MSVSKPPIKEGDIRTVTVEQIGAKGDGIARINGFVVIIPDTHVGDQVKIKITKVRERNAFAERIEELEE